MGWFERFQRKRVRLRGSKTRRSKQLEIVMSAERTDQILDLAEREMRKGGFDAVSFRDIAAAIGIKSASVHYHFPTKADLGAAVVHRYAERFLNALGTPLDATETAEQRIDTLAQAYVQAYHTEHATCLCAVLGSVYSVLPNAAAIEIGVFYDRLLAWIETALEGCQTPLTANTVVSVLQGALALSIARQDATPLVDARRLLARLLQ
jgi:TetR/AcrR family transcriptional repressor of nem operon